MPAFVHSILAVAVLLSGGRCTVIARPRRVARNPVSWKNWDFEACDLKADSDRIENRSALGRAGDW